MDVSILIPVFNADSLIDRVIEELEYLLSTEGLQYEILFWDDGSSDQSLEILKGKRSKNIQVFRNDSNEGLGYTLRKLFSVARGQSLIYCDIDLPFGGEGIMRIIEELKGADIVVASRYVGVRNNVSLLRKILSRLYYKFCCLLFDVPVLDIGSGTVGFQKSIIDSITLQSDGFEIHMELFLEFKRCNALIKEVGLSSNTAIDGSFSILKHGWWTVISTLQLWKRKRC